MPDPDWVMVLGNRTNPWLELDSVNIMSRSKNADNMPPEVLSAFNDIGYKLGLEIRIMCDIDNTDCPYFL